MIENSGLIKVGVSQEDLEESIAGLRELKPILQQQVMNGNGCDTKQGLKDAAELGKHFDTAIDAMCMLLSGFMGVINRRAGENSVGAKLERKYAEKTGKDIFYRENERKKLEL